MKLVTWYQEAASGVENRCDTVYDSEEGAGNNVTHG